MVWFQCEDCGENLKKPKLPNHFRICSASKLSCIDCGEVFGQQAVQSHTQCITEEEKYGPKGQGKVSSVKPAKPMKDQRKPDFDVFVGLSDRPPWFCSLCNTKATSKQTLLGHAEGKKHRAKARAFHAANQPPKPVEEPTLTHVYSKDKSSETELQMELDDKNGNGPLSAKSEDEKLPAGNGNTPIKKKRKIGASEDEVDMKSFAPRNGKVAEIRVEEKRSKESMKVKFSEEVKSAKYDLQKEVDMIEPGTTNGGIGGSAKKVKLKKLITSALKSRPDGILEMRKLQKLVLQAFEESGVHMDENELRNFIQKKINSSSKFEVDGKYVRLATKERN